MISQARTFDPATEVVGLSPQYEASLHPERHDPGIPVEGLTIGIARMSQNSPHGGEMHPDGDETLYLISGRVRVVLLDSDEPDLELNPGTGLIVPRGGLAPGRYPRAQRDHVCHAGAQQRVSAAELTLRPGPGRIAPRAGSVPGVGQLYCAAFSLAGSPRPKAMETHADSPQTFAELKLPASLLAALDEVGYETPSPIQAQAIPMLLAGRDLLGHAPTGTGKTAAFSLPLLARLDLASKAVQVLVLAPTRELAIQVSEAFQRYASKMPGFHVLPIYGGQEYGPQLRQLRRGVQVVVGTPGRVMDHMRRGSLGLKDLRALVLDEADEMLRMGFIDDVEWILEHAPSQRQMALFSATMPAEIERIARRHLKDPESIEIAARTATAATISQRYWLVSGVHKLDALTRVLEVEPFDAALIFVRTKIATTELAEKLEARGHAAAAINGDMVQQNREQVIDRLKRGTLDILVATDVAARGLDVDRITHVINYDIPYDAEAYIHRIGRTGRAGRQGEAILFVAPRERRMLKTIERATRQPIDRLELPSTEMVNNKRLADYRQRITDTLAAGELDFLRSLFEQYQQEHNVPALDIAAAVAKLAMGDQPLLLKDDPRPPPASKERDRSERKAEKTARKRHEKKAGKAGRSDRGRTSGKARRDGDRPEKGMDRYRIEVGHQHGVKPGNIVGAIASEAGLDSRYIGRINIEQDHSTVDLPSGMPGEVFDQLKKTWVCGQRLRLSRIHQKPRRESGGKK